VKVKKSFLLKLVKLITAVLLCL